MENPAPRTGRSAARWHGLPTAGDALRLAVPLCLGVVLWQQALHSALGATEHGEPAWWLHWLRDAALALPVVGAAVWGALALVRRLGGRLRPEDRVPAAVAGCAVATSYVLAVGSPLHAWLFAAHQATAEPPLGVHIARDALLALPAALLIAAAAVRLGLAVAPPERMARAGAQPGVALTLTRRRVVQLGVAGGAGLLLPFEWVRAAAGSSPTSPPVTPFGLALPLPAPGVPTRTAGTDVYAIEARVAESQIFPTGAPTRIWGYDGRSPGPTILAEAGRPVEITFRNGLIGEREPGGERVELSTHVHGGHQSPADDGYPTDSPTTGFTALIEPGASRPYHYPNFRDLANGIPESGKPLWYHDHLMDVTGFNVYQGLAGLYLVHAAEEDELNLPGTGTDAMENHGYGRVDIPLVLQDRIFNADHSLLYPHEDKGVLGDRFLVNGAIQPFLDVERRKYRFRIYDGSNRRWYQLALSNGQPFVQVGTEAGLLPAPVVRGRILLSPAERADVIIDFTHAPSTVDLMTLPAGIDEADVRVPLVRFNVREGAVTDASKVPESLRQVEPLPPPDVRRSFRFDRRGGEWTVDGERFEPDRPLFQVRLDAVEEWTFANNSGGWVHPIHVHDVPFQVISHGGRPPQPWEQGEKDTVGLGHGDDATVRMQFIDFTGTYVFHCHNMEHEDMRMMTRFDIVA
jgi:FtsP/CotA-like multicopper oxidase with cupredoxin domain